MSRDVIIDKIFIASAPGFVLCLLVPAVNAIEEVSRLFGYQADGIDSIVGFSVSQDSFAGSGIVEIIEQKFDSAVADVYSEMFFGHMLCIVGLIDYDKAIIRQHRCSVVFEHKVAEHQCVIGHDDISVFQSPSGAPVETAGEMRTLSAAAVAVLALDRIPDMIFRHKWDVAE